MDIVLGLYFVSPDGRGGHPLTVCQYTKDHLCSIFPWPIRCQGYDTGLTYYLLPTLTVQPTHLNLIVYCQGHHNVWFIGLIKLGRFESSINENVTKKLTLHFGICLKKMFLKVFIFV